MWLGFCSSFFNLQGAFENRGNPSLPQSLRGPDATSHSPRPRWGRSFPWRTPPGTSRVPANAQEGSSHGTVTVTEKIVLTPVKRVRETLFRTVTMSVKIIAIEAIGVNAKYKKEWAFIAKRQVLGRFSEWEITKRKCQG